MTWIVRFHSSGSMFPLLRTQLWNGNRLWGIRWKVCRVEINSFKSNQKYDHWNIYSSKKFLSLKFLFTQRTPPPHFSLRKTDIVSYCIIHYSLLTKNDKVQSLVLSYGTVWEGTASVKSVDLGDFELFVLTQDMFGHLSSGDDDWCSYAYLKYHENGILFPKYLIIWVYFEWDTFCWDICRNSDQKYYRIDHHILMTSLAFDI